MKSSGKIPEFYLKHIKDCCLKIISLTENIDYDEFCDDWKVSDLVIRQIEIIGEASNQLPEVFKEENSHVPWREIIDMRNNLIHQYFGVDLAIVWDVSIHEIPNLLKEVRTLLNKSK